MEVGWQERHMLIRRVEQPHIFDEEINFSSGSLEMTMSDLLTTYFLQTLTGFLASIGLRATVPSIRTVDSTGI